MLTKIGIIIGWICIVTVTVAMAFGIIAMIPEIILL